MRQFPKVFYLGGGSSTPPLPNAPANPNTPTLASSQVASSAANTLAAARGGFSSTIATSALGLPGTPNTAKKSLLGQ